MMVGGIALGCGYSLNEDCQLTVKPRRLYVHGQTTRKQYTTEKGTQSQTQSQVHVNQERTRKI